MESKMYGVFPQLLWVDDEDLRNKCVATWEAGLKSGGKTVDILKEMPFVLTELKDCPVLLVDHIRNVTETAAGMCDFLNAAYDVTVKINRDFVVAGAILHDVGKLLEYEKTETGYGYSEYGTYLRHPAAGAILACENGVPKEIVNIILNHSFEGEKSHQTKEAYVVKTADWLNFNYLSFTYPNQMKHKSHT